MSLRRASLRLRIAEMMIVAGATLTLAPPVQAQGAQIAARPDVHLPAESEGIDQIVQTLIAAFEQADIVALGEVHGQQVDSDVRIALVRHPEFARKVRFIVVEFASTAQQPTLDRYIDGGEVSRAELAKVWQTTSQSQTSVWDSPIYADFLAAVREVNRGLPIGSRIRVLAGDPPAGSTVPRDAPAVSALKHLVLETHGKALVIYGAAHFYRREVGQILLANGGGITKLVEADYPGRTFVVLPIGGSGDEINRFERALATSVRPVLVSLQRPPFRDFSAQEFIPLMNCLGAKRVPDDCVSAFHGSGATLGQLGDAAIYWRAADKR